MLVFFELRAQLVSSDGRNELILSNSYIFSSVSEGGRTIVSSTWDLIDALASSINRKLQDFLSTFEPVGLGKGKFLFRRGGVERMRGKVQLCHVNVCKYYIAESIKTPHSNSIEKVREEMEPFVLIGIDFIH